MNETRFMRFKRSYEVKQSNFFANLDELVKSPRRSLRGARRRGNPLEIQWVMRLPRFARNDKSGLFRTFYQTINLDSLVKSSNLVTPAKAGVQNSLNLLDSGSSPE